MVLALQSLETRMVTDISDVFLTILFERVRKSSKEHEENEVLESLLSNFVELSTLLSSVPWLQAKRQ